MQDITGTFLADMDSPQEQELLQLNRTKVYRLDSIDDIYANYGKLTRLTQTPIAASLAASDWDAYDESISYNEHLRIEKGLSLRNNNIAIIGDVEIVGISTVAGMLFRAAEFWLQDRKSLRMIPGVLKLEDCGEELYDNIALLERVLLSDPYTTFDVRFVAMDLYPLKNRGVPLLRGERLYVEDIAFHDGAEERSVLQEVPVPRYAL